MHELPLPVAVTYTVALALSAAGIVQLTGSGLVRRTYYRWGYPARIYRLTGTLELLAGILIITSRTHLAGVILAAAMNFIVVVLLLKNRAYLLATPGIAVMAALPVTLLRAF